MKNIQNKQGGKYTGRLYHNKKQRQKKKQNKTTLQLLHI